MQSFSNQESAYRVCRTLQYSGEETDEGKMPNFATNATHGFFYRFIQPETVIGTVHVLTLFSSRVFNGVFNKVFSFHQGFHQGSQQGSKQVFQQVFNKIFNWFLNLILNRVLKIDIIFQCCEKNNNTVENPVEKSSLSTG